MADEGAEPPATPAVNVVVPNLQPPTPLTAESPTIVENRKLWKQQWNNYLIVSGLGLKEKNYQTALLLHCFGRDTLHIFNAMTVIFLPNQAFTISVVCMYLIYCL